MALQPYQLFDLGAFFVVAPPDEKPFRVYKTNLDAETITQIKKFATGDVKRIFLQ